MDENNNTNQENGFVLQDTPTSEPVQQQTIQPELQKEEQQSEQQGQQESRFQAQPEPQPMPSGDNTYRFQNTETRRTPGGSERKKGVPVTKLIVSAVVFGVVAAACFFGVTKLLTFAVGGSSSSDIGQTQPKIPVTTVSGTAASQVGVSDIVEQVMPSIVAITEKSTRTSYFFRGGRIRIYRETG